MKITFLGAAGMVTGSCYMVEIGKKKLLVDCGMYQGSRLIRAFNERDFAFDPASIDLVVLTHAHIDHSGLLPKLVKQGFKGKIHCTRVTKELCEILLPDSAHIQESEAEFANRKGMRAGKPVVLPLYTVDEAEIALQKFATHDFNQTIELFDGVKIIFRVAGHILGSAFVEFFIREEQKETKVIFTGDVGQPNQPIMKDPSEVPSADFIITESTYGDRLHPEYDREEELKKIVLDTVERGGNLIIPAFAVGRTQVMLYYLKQLMSSKQIPEIPIIIDSPMATKATQITLLNPSEYDEEAKTIYNEEGSLLYLPQVKFTASADESKAINFMQGPLIIISASGMADAGRILHHLKHNLWRADSTVLFAGYQAEGSMGRALIDGAKRVKIMGEDIIVKAHIHFLDGFSAHADKKQLLEWFAEMQTPPKAFFVVHGEPHAAQSLAMELQRNLGTATNIPQYGDSVVIDGTDWHMETSPFVQEVIPDTVDLRNALKGFEKDLSSYKSRMEQIAIRDSSKAKDMRKKIEKARKYLDDLLKNL
ncbi:MAG TPA: MBL fold metallo-hydrolase [Candidatus Avacidaminococcus intestinavium]|uniref:MBL fold metallo-hydrolase n=1 Tax=Candidatus Avacidaminococcus intestinavium TaxID=2840684 RepID=A0A9D1SLK4_9FIRM|nr:MBL fold metallo-hydrolase [Candidatus Avacidaminococcus intestinavium]